MKVRFEDVITRVTGNVDRYCTELEYYVGGDQYDSSALTIERRGDLKKDVDLLGFKFHFPFKSGDVLLMARNPHLRKAAQVFFDGLCSDASYILRTKDENKLRQNYIPLILQSNLFWDWFESHKTGGITFLLNWGMLKTYEFELPNVDVQDDLMGKVWAAYKLKQSYQRLINATDEMVKSRFIELFCNIDKVRPLSEWIGTTFPGEWGNDDADGTGVKVLRTTNFTNSGKLDLTNVVTRNIEAHKIQKKQLKPGDIILERSGGTADNPVGRVVYFDTEGIFLFNNFTQLLRCKEGVNSMYVFYSLFNYYQTHKNKIRSMGNKTTGIQNLKMDKYWNIPIADASKDLQEEFVSLYKQADKSKYLN